VPVPQRLPALALSGFTAPEAQQQVLAAGFNAHLAKPAHPRRLLTELAGLRGPVPGGSRAAAEGMGPPSPPIEV
jgi:ATP-binding cassette subfamily B protein